MNATEQRQRLREVLAADECIRPASVFDPISARIASVLGFQVGMFAGSVASATVLAKNTTDADALSTSLLVLGRTGADIVRKNAQSILLVSDKGEQLAG